MSLREFNTLPGDIRHWGRHLRAKQDSKEIEIQPRTVKPKPRPPSKQLALKEPSCEKMLLEHWRKLLAVVEEWLLGLRFEEEYELKKHRINGKEVYWGFWWSSEKELRLSIYFHPLSRHLVRHLDCEFDRPRVSYDLEYMHEHVLAPPCKRDLDAVRMHPTVARLRDRLLSVCRRSTFLGTCSICRKWFVEQAPEEKVTIASVRQTIAGTSGLHVSAVSPLKRHSHDGGDVLL